MLKKGASLCLIIAALGIITLLALFSRLGVLPAEAQDPWIQGEAVGWYNLRLEPSLVEGKSGLTTHPGDTVWVVGYYQATYGNWLRLSSGYWIFHTGVSGVDIGQLPRLTYEGELYQTLPETRPATAEEKERWKPRVGEVYQPTLSASAQKALTEGRYTVSIWVTVQYGDTLWSIARRWNTTVKEICQLNALADPNYIWVGQRLQIP